MSRISTSLEEPVVERSRRRGAKKGVDFTLMISGMPNTGKRTFINSLCDGPVYVHAEEPTFEGSNFEVQFRKREVELLLEDGNINLTVVDTPGFGRGVSRASHPGALREYLENQFDVALDAERQVRRDKSAKDGRVHCCLYFLARSTRGLCQLDIETLKQIGNLVNVIPIISMADTLTPDEKQELKKSIANDLLVHNIKTYDFSYDADEEDQDAIDEALALKELVPFTVVGSNYLFEYEGKNVRGNQYTWGFLNVEDPNISDFVTLRAVVLHSHLPDLKSVTSDILYENFRTIQLQKEKEGILDSNVSLRTSLD